MTNEEKKVVEAVIYRLEKAKIWGGTEWKFNPLHPIHYLPAIKELKNLIK